MMRESVPRNSDEIRWWLRRLKNYMIEDDEPLIKEFNELLKDVNVNDIDKTEMKEYEMKMEEVLNICNVLDKFPMKKIESYIRKRKLDNLNRINEPQSKSIGVDECTSGGI